MVVEAIVGQRGSVHRTQPCLVVHSWSTHVSIPRDMSGSL